MENKIKDKVIQTQHYLSPCGELMLGSYENRLCLCDWVIRTTRNTVDKRLQKALQASYQDGASEVIVKAAGQLDEYFRGERKAFDIPLLLVGTVFQKSVWTQLLEIPYGTTQSYGEISGLLGMPQAVRAVANANGANALSVFIPCHRVIGSNHTLTGYAGGIAAKKWLLELEAGTTSSQNRLF